MAAGEPESTGAPGWGSVGRASGRMGAEMLGRQARGRRRGGGEDGDLRAAPRAEGKLKCHPISSVGRSHFLQFPVQTKKGNCS